MHLDSSVSGRSVLGYIKEFICHYESFQDQKSHFKTKNMITYVISRLNKIKSANRNREQEKVKKHQKGDHYLNKLLGKITCEECVYLQPI
jgi:hypothetical protein